MTIDRSGNTLRQARSINLEGGIRLRDQVDATDINDFYRFRVKSSSNGFGMFNLSVTGLRANADAALLDSRGRVLQKSAHRGRKSESISMPLSAGTYYVRVYRRRGSTFYNLNLIVGIVPDSTSIPDPGSPIDSPPNVPIIGSQTAISDSGFPIDQPPDILPTQSSTSLFF